MLDSPNWSVQHLFECLLDKLLSDRIAVVKVVSRNRLGFPIRSTGPFLFEAVEVLSKQHTVLLVLAHQNLGQWFKVKVVLSVHWQHCIIKVGCLQHLGHVLDFLKAEGLVLFKDNGLAYSFHAILYQEAVQISVAGLVEVFAVDFGDHEFNFECLAELLRLAQLKNYFF